MNAKLFRALDKFYASLYTTMLRNKKKIEKESIFLSFLKMSSNTSYELLSESSIHAHKISAEMIDELQNLNLIRATDSLNKYAITAIGIWEVENKTDLISMPSFLTYVDEKYFNVYANSSKPLNDKQKVIIFSMIAARTFSDKSSVDLKRNDDTTNAWKEITDQVYYKLKDMGIISNLKIESQDGKSLYGKLGTEKPVSNLYRHTDKLPKLTKGIYKAPGQQKYYLDLSDNCDLFKDQLIYLFNLVIGNKQISYSEINDLSDFCRNISNEKNIYVFAPQDHIFSKSEYDEVINDILLLM